MSRTPVKPRSVGRSNVGEVPVGRPGRLGGARSRLLWVAVVLLMIGGAMVGYAEVGRGSTGVQWLIGQSGIDTINSYTGSTTLTANVFNSRSSYVFSLPVASNWLTHRTAYYTSYAAFSAAVAHHRVPAGTTEVMYDNENWSSTPLREQSNPATYERNFVTLAHQHGYRAILTPALNIVNNMACFNGNLTLLQNYLNCGVPRMSAAAGADVFEIQAQGNEDALSTNCATNPGSFYCVVTKSAAQARTVAPNLTIWAGLSTNHQGMVSSGSHLYTDSRNTASVVQGYWLNVPKQSPGCPSCSPDGAPQVAVDYLHLMGYKG